MANNLFSQIFNAASGAASKAGVSVANIIPGGDAKRRAAVVAHDGFKVLDGYNNSRTILFVGGLAGAAASGYALYKRRGRGFEAWGVWGTLFAVSAGLAWLARPSPGVTAPVQAPDGTVVQPSAVIQAERWLDSRANNLDVSEPGWEDATLARLLGS